MQKLTLQNILQSILGLFLFIFPWQTVWIYKEYFLNGVKWQYGTLGFYGSEIVLWIAVLLFMVWFWKKNKEQGTKNRFTFSKDRIFVLCCVSLISYLLISSLWSINPDVAFQQALHVLEAFLLFFMLFLGPLNFNGIAKWFVAGAVVQSILGIFQFLAQSSFSLKWLGMVSHPAWIPGTSIVDAGGRWLRAYGAFPHPNIFGGYLVVALTFMFLLYAREKYQSNSSLFIYHSSFIILLTALFFTFSRSAWIAGIMVTLLYGYIAIRTRNREQGTHIMYHVSCIISVVTVFAILSTIFFPLVKTRIIGGSAHEVRSTTERISGYHDAWQLFKQHPMCGVGAGNYSAALHALYPDRAGWDYEPVHNGGALMLVELGLVGVALFMFIGISFITYLLSRLRFAAPGKLLSHISYLFYALPITGYALLLLFDHYLLSLYIGLILSAVLWGGVSRLVHELSTE